MTRGDSESEKETPHDDRVTFIEIDNQPGYAAYYVGESGHQHAAAGDTRADALRDLADRLEPGGGGEDVTPPDADDISIPSSVEQTTHESHGRAIAIDQGGERFIRASDSVTKMKLQTLVKEWRNELPRNGTFREAADQLERMINDE